MRIRKCTLLAFKPPQIATSIVATLYANSTIKCSLLFLFPTSTRKVYNFPVVFTFSTLWPNVCARTLMTLDCVQTAIAMFLLQTDMQFVSQNYNQLVAMLNAIIVQRTFCLPLTIGQIYKHICIFEIQQLLVIVVAGE